MPAAVPSALAASAPTTSASPSSAAAPQPRKRYRRAELDSAADASIWGEDDGGEGSEEEAYVPLKVRKEREAQRHRARLAALGVALPGADAGREDGGGGGGGEGEGGGAGEGGASAPSLAPSSASGRPRDSLLRANARAIAAGTAETEEERLAREERELIEAVKARKALRTHAELATGERPAAVPWTGWRPSLRVRLSSERARQAVRDRHRIVAEGASLPPACERFEDMHLPGGVVAYLKRRSISAPSPIQMQGLPAALAGRDLIGVAATGSGKTLVFAIPLVAAAWQEEARMPLEGGEGPIGIVLSPSRELARQTHAVVEEMFADVAADGGPELRALLAIGGSDVRAQAALARERGVHAAVATPGRLKDLLTRRTLSLNLCRLLCLDEADRMVDVGFEEDVREILSFFSSSRQVLMISATMPDKIRAFAESALVDPVTVDVGRAGAANANVLQEVAWVREADRLPYVLEALQKTPPPVVIFAENKRDVDAVHEYLLKAGVDAVASHGGKDQAERERAVDAFRAKTKDVLVATDVASKGLDFDDVRHVINYDMPTEIENYVHRIGRTGRRGRAGVATTIVDRNVPESTLLDLKHLLVEAKQRVPPFLATIHDPMEAFRKLDASSASKGCAYCGGLGHRIADCPKLRADMREQTRQKTDAFGGGGYGAEM